MLRTQIKASSITNLTDARYFAAWEVTWMGFCLDPTDETYLPPRQLEAIRGWIDGPRFVGEFNLQGPGEISEATDMLQLQGIQAGPFTTADTLRALPSDVPVIKEWVLDRDTDPDQLRASLDEFAPLAGTFLLDFQRGGLSWDDLSAGRPFSPALLREICATYPTLLAIDLPPEEMLILLEQLQPAGLSLRGGAEERVGFKSFDELDDILEALQA